MLNSKDKWQYMMMAVFMVGLALTMMVPVFAAPGDNITGKSLTVSGPGDGTRPGGPAGGPWGTMQIIDISGLNAYYASIGDATHCTWEFHPGNDVNNGWSFGALSKDSGSDLEIMRKVGGDWKPIDLLVDFDSGRVGIGTTSPSAMLDVITGSDVGIKSYSHDSYGIYGISTNSSGILGSSSHSGVEGVSTIGRGVYGTSDSGNGVEGYSTTNIGVYGQSGNISSYAGYFDGNVNITGNLIANGDNITSGTTGGVKHFKWMGAVNFDGNIYSNDWADIKAYPGLLPSQRTFGMSCKNLSGCTYVSYLDGVRKSGNLNSGDTENITMSGNLSDARFLFGKKTNGMALLQGDVLDTNGAYMHFIIHDIEE